jgi:hypothetical protein
MARYSTVNNCRRGRMSSCNTSQTRRFACAWMFRGKSCDGSPRSTLADATCIYARDIPTTTIIFPLSTSSRYGKANPYFFGSSFYFWRASGWYDTVRKQVNGRMSKSPLSAHWAPTLEKRLSLFELDLQKALLISGTARASSRPLYGYHSAGLKNK